MQDLISYICFRATQSFGGNDGVFNATNFGNQFTKITGLKNTIDGNAVKAILWGRKDVELLSGGSHYRFLQK